MNRLIRSITACGFVLSLGAAAVAQVPRLIPYQGVYTDTSGNPKPDASYSFTFAIYDVATSGSALWSETRSITVKGGLFNTYLGEGTAIPATVKFDRPYWLGIKIGAGTEMSPRVKLGASAFSFTAVSADTSRAAYKADLATTADSARAAGKADTAAVALSAQSVQNVWGMTGNGGTNPASHFLGTTDSQVLEIKVKNDRAIRLEPTTGSPNVIGGHKDNITLPGVRGAAVSGGGQLGSGNRVTDDFGFVGGGSNNQAGDNAGTTNDRTFATVSGGNANKAAGGNSTVAGGSGNTASGLMSAIGGGISNTTSGNTAAIFSGSGNLADSTYSFVGGGYSNVSGGFGTAIAGGYQNRTDFNYGFVGGGSQNNAAALNAVVVGGSADTASGPNAAVVGGGGNKASGQYSFIGGGYYNFATNTEAAVAGGIGNYATGATSFVGGGDRNNATATNSAVAGGLHGMAAAQTAFVGAGSMDTVTAAGLGSFIGAGFANKAANSYGAIGAGAYNAILGSYGVIGGGYADTLTAAAAYSVIGGGYRNIVTGDYAMIGGGAYNSVSGNYSSVGAGHFDTISGAWSAIPAGRLMKIAGNNSFAAGYNGTLNGSGSVLLCDSSGTKTTHSADNRLYARFANGYYLYTSQALSTGMYAPAGATSWSVISDSAKKENFKPVNGEEMLGKLDRFRVGTWNYKGQDKKTMRHYGVMAQDLFAAYGHDGVGTVGNDTSIFTQDMEGVNFSLIAALEKRTRELKSVKTELGATRAEVDALKEKIASMEAVLQEVLVKIAVKEQKGEKVRLAKSEK